MLEVKSLREIVRTVLQLMDVLTRGAGFWTQAAEELVLCTIAKESLLLTWDRQIGGPAVGACQMEPDTESDIWNKWLLPRRQDLVRMIGRICGAKGPDPERLRLDLIYNIIMCRLRYYRVPEPLPEAHNIDGLALYWKKFFNTHRGKGRPEEFVEVYYKLVLV
jgi:hypothetical protein